MKYFIKNNLIHKNKGYAILFSVVVISVISVIAIGLSNATFKQLILSSLANDSQSSFYQSDMATECALYADNVLLMNGSSPSPWRCGVDPNGNDYILNISSQSEYDYNVNPSVSSTSLPCFDFNVKKTNSDPVVTEIYARGYNICDKSNSKTVEREIKVTY